MGLASAKALAVLPVARRASQCSRQTMSRPLAITIGAPTHVHKVGTRAKSAASDVNSVANAADNAI